MKKLHVIFATGLIFTLIMATFSGCSKSEKTRGVTDREIVIGQWGPQTGPAALWGAVARGTAAYFKMINDEGGINGRKIRYIYRDDAYQPAKTKAIVKELVEKEGVFAFVGGVGTSGGMAVKKYLAQHHVPWVGPSTGSLHFCYPPEKYLFSVYPTYSDEASILVDYTINSLDMKNIAFIYQNDDYGKEGLIGAQLSMKQNEMEFVEITAINPVDTDLSSHILKLKEAGADAVIMYLMPKQAAISLGTAMKLDFKPQWIASSTLSDIPLMFAVTKGLWKNVIFSSISEASDGGNPLVEKYKKAQQKYAPDEKWTTFYYAGFVFAEPLIEGLKKAGRNLTPETFVKAMESIKNFKGIGPEVSYGPGIRRGVKSIYLAKCVSAFGSEKLTDWITSDINIEDAAKLFQQR